MSIQVKEWKLSKLSVVSSNYLKNPTIQVPSQGIKVWEAESGGYKLRDHASVHCLPGNQSEAPMVIHFFRDPVLEKQD